MLVVEKDPKSIGSEGFKKLRTNIEYSGYDKKNQVLLITSSQAEEGKSIISGNLALSLSQDGKKVILIDCDLRKPSLHKKFNISNEKGLTEVILGKELLLETLYKYSKNMDILTCGKIPPNSAEMLGSKNMEKLLEELKEHYDYIILDTPPVLAVADSQILATRADGIIFVVKANKTKKDVIVRAKKELDRIGASLIGTVLNTVKIGEDNYYYGNY